jgi:hypothetical protein
MRHPSSTPRPALAALAAAGLASLLAALPLASAAAQGRDTTARDTTARDSARAEAPAQPSSAGVLARDVANEVVTLYNAPSTLRVSGSLDVAPGRVIEGNVAVLDGPLTIAGEVHGSVVAINADVVLKPSARIDGDVIVVGGIVQGRTEGYVGGDIRVYREVLYYREEEGRLVVARAESGGEADERWWQRWRNRRSRRTRGDILLSTAHTYNRVEGLPVYLGPAWRQDVALGRLSVEATGILRSADHFHWDSRNIGHRAKGELRLGGRSGVTLGGAAYDSVDAVEPWQLTSAEVGLASFFLHRDYRDYFGRHGGAVYATLHVGRDVALGLKLSDERWASRDVRDPFTLFRDGAGWRANPRLDDGRFHVATGTLQVDTRNDVDNPWAGWFLVADFERGSGAVTSFGPRSTYGAAAPVSPTTAVPGTRVTYSRGFLDLRRYNRLAPNAQLNLRLVLGGALGGDELPLERRLSVGGPGTIPGYDFRSLPRSGPDVLQCSSGSGGEPAGVPAQCDRIALVQAEYRGDLRLDLDGDDEEEGGRWHWWDYGLHRTGSWVVFADAGRGWLLAGTRAAVGAPRDLVYRREAFPALSTFRTDVGIGVDFDPVGFYVAKSVSDAKEPANFLVRVRKRF